MNLYVIDYETRSEADIDDGLYKYVTHPSTEVLCVSAAPVDGGDPWLWSPSKFFSFDKDPFFHILPEDACFIAHNAGFDRLITEHVLPKHLGFPASWAHTDRWMCSARQASASLLPYRLTDACKAAKLAHKKDPRGKELIRKLSIGPWDPHYKDSEEMEHMRIYCARDVLATRALWHATRPLTAAEWAWYAMNERINDRGVYVDQVFAEKAAKLAKALKSTVDDELGALRPGLTASAHVAKGRFLGDLLRAHEGLREACRKPSGAYSCDQSRRTLLREAFCNDDVRDHFDPDTLKTLEAFLDALDRGSGVAAKKYDKMLQLVDSDGRLRGQYVFMGAGQTGRFSSWGVQIHNLKRRTPEDRPFAEVRSVLLGGGSANVDQATLGACLRPTFRAAPGKVLTWGDWSAIEARVLPWLADHVQARPVLQAFEQGRDIYVETAAKLLRKRPDQVTKHDRQVAGKVPTLFLGYGGGRGAFLVGARAYGLQVTETEAEDFKHAWRRANPWANAFWQALKNGWDFAFDNPGNWVRAGRVRYLYHRAHHTMYCALPSGRPLVYPAVDAEWRYVEKIDRRVRQFTFRAVEGNSTFRKDVWYGLLAENVTQAVAADVLMTTLERVERAGLDVVLHTHDEVVIEDTEGREKELVELMETLPDWAEGLPLKAEAESGERYGK